MPDVVSGIYDVKRVGNEPFFDGNLFANIKLRYGEVIAIVPPTSERSVSKRFYEYDVLVPQYESGTVAHKLYRNCLLNNALAGGGDHSKWKLRASTRPYTEIGKTDGSRVLILCVEGSNNQAVIVGGLRDERSGEDLEENGHHYEFEFNGVNFQVNDDGSFVCQQKGKTTNLGLPHEDRNKKAGTSIEVKPEGSFVVKTKDNNQSITIDNTSNTITINSDQKVTINGDKICLGGDASNPVAKSNELISILEEILAGIQSITMVSIAGSLGPFTSPPLNAAQFASISARLSKIKSSQTYLKS